MMFSMSFTKQHILKHKYVIDCPGNDLHDKIFYGETVTKKRNEYEFGKSVSIYYFDDPKTFNSIHELLKSKGLVLTQNKK